MDEILSKLQDLAKQKDKEIEDYLEEFAEEKVQSSLEIKMKYQKMMNMLKGKVDQEEKLKQLEEKKRKDEQEMQAEMNDAKAKRTQEIKEKYNKQAGEIGIQFDAIRDGMRAWGQLRPQQAPKIEAEEKPHIEQPQV